MTAAAALAMPVAVFALRSAAADANAVVRQRIERGGFDVIDAFDGVLPAGFTFIERLGSLRYASFAAGAPLTLFVAVDLCPWKGTGRIASAEAVAAVDNERLVRLDELNDQLAAGDVLAATPTASEAWRLIEALQPERARRYREEIAARASQMTPPFPVLRNLTDYGNNAATYLVTYRGREAICKVFRQGRERHMQNELDGLALGERIREIPRCLETRGNWLVMEAVERARSLEEWKNRLGLIPLRFARATFGVLRAIHEAGYAHMDFRPAHVLVRPSGEITVIDFDRLHRYTSIPEFEQGYSIAGFDASMLLDAPNGPPPTYATIWQPCVGLTFASLQNDSVPLQHAKRALVAAVRAARGVARRLRHAWRAP